MARIELEHLAVPPYIDTSPYIPEVSADERIRTCVLLGSFGKFHDQINETIDTFETAGIHVLAPKRAPITDGEGFQLLATDATVMDDLQKKYPHVPWSKDHYAAVIEKIFKETISQAGFVYIVDPSNIMAPDGNYFPKGYAGTMVAGEIGHAMAAKKPIYAMEPLDVTLDDNESVWPVMWQGIANQIKTYTPDKIIEMVNSEKLDVADYQWCDGYEFKW